MKMVETLRTLQELVAEVATRIAALPAPRNGQVRAIPDDRTVRYYGTIGLLDRPSAMRGRTALYGRKHVAQVVAIKRLQAMGRSLSEIQTLWPTLDAATLARMSGVELAAEPQPPARTAFWKCQLGSLEPVEASGASLDGAAGDTGDLSPTVGSGGAALVSSAPMINTIKIRRDAGATPIVGVAGPERPSEPGVELRIELAPNVILSLSVVDDRVAMSPADVRALRAAAAPLVAELASRRITPHSGGGEP
jgi:hypothetical protein